MGTLAEPLLARDVAIRRLRRALRLRWLTSRASRSSCITLAAGLGAIALVTIAAFQLHLNLTAAAFLHLIVVVLVARQTGFGIASVVSVAAVIGQLYFLVPPALSWAVADGQNWIALATFEYCALIVSRLSHKAMRQTALAERRRAETEGLYEISRLVLLIDRNREPGPQLMALIKNVFNCDTAILFDSESAQFAAHGLADATLEMRTRDAYFQANDYFDENDRIWFRVVRNGIRSAGALALRGGQISEPVANALASLVAVAMERARSFEKESRAELARQSEQLRTAVLDALAHEVKTPLTAIRAASSGLLEAGALDPDQTELVALIDDECARVTEITNRLLGMARLDARDVRLKSGTVHLDALLRRIVAATELRAPGRTITIRGVPGGGNSEELTVPGDEQLLAIAVTQLIDNAVKYSAPDSEILAGIEGSREEAVLTVHNFGAAIAAADLAQIFERFYRGAGVAQRFPGTGLGLSITRKIVAAHCGRIWVVSGERGGTTFFLALPLHRDRQTG